MINIDKDSNSELYQDWNKCLNFLNNLNYDDYKYPKEVSNFHIYSEIKRTSICQIFSSYSKSRQNKSNTLVRL